MLCPYQQDALHASHAFALLFQRVTCTLRLAQLFAAFTSVCLCFSLCRYCPALVRVSQLFGQTHHTGQLVVEIVVDTAC